MSTTTTPTRLRSVAAGTVAATLLLAGVACSNDDDTRASTTTTPDAQASTTSTTLPGNTPTVSEAYAPHVDDSGAGVTAKVYLTITGGAEDNSLVGVKVGSDVAASATLTPDSSVALPATETVSLDPDSTYIELTDLAEPLEINRGFDITLEFENSPEQTVEVVVQDSSTPDGSGSMGDADG